MLFHNLQALEVIRKLRDVMPISRACMLLRVITPTTSRLVMKAFLDENNIVIVAESSRNVNNSNTSIGGDDQKGEKGEGEGELGGDKNSKVIQEYSSDSSSSSSMFFDIKVDPELFRKVEEAVSTIAGGTCYISVVVDFHLLSFLLPLLWLSNMLLLDRNVTPRFFVIQSYILRCYLPRCFNLIHFILF